MASPTVDVVVQAQDRARAVLRSVDKQLQKTRGTLASMEEPQNRVTGAITAGHAAMAALAGGVMVATAQQLGELALAGAKTADQYDAIAARVSNLDTVIRLSQAATAGVLSRAAIVDVTAQFDAFGLSIDLVDETLEQVQKTSIRTGRDAGMLTDSLVEGVSKLSDPRLDNLGIIGAVKAAKIELDLMGEAFTDADVRALVLKNSLRQLAAQNADIDINDTRTASLRRLAAAWEDAADAAQIYLADVVDFYAGGNAKEQANALVNDVAKIGAAWSQTSKSAGTFIGDITHIADLGSRTKVEMGELGKAFAAMPAKMRLDAWHDLERRTRGLQPEIREATLAIVGFHDELQGAAVAEFAGQVHNLGASMRSVAIGAYAAVAAAAGSASDVVAEGVGKLGKALKAEGDRQAKAAGRGGSAASAARERAAAEAEALEGRVRGLQQEIALAQTKDERQRAVLELTFEEARIDREITDSLEHQLSMQAALLDYKEKIAKIDGASQESLALQFAREWDKGAAAARGAREAAREAVGVNIESGFAEAGKSLQLLSELAGDNTTLANFSGLGSALQSVGATWGDFAKAGDTSAKAIAGASAATLAALAPSVAAFGRNVQEKAGIMAAFEAAMAIATAFENPAASVGHGIAAAMFAAQAGGAFGGAPSAPATAGGGSAAFGGGGFGSAGGSGGAPTYIVNVGSTHGGMVIGTEQTIARAVKEQMHAARGTGHRAGA